MRLFDDCERTYMGSIVPGESHYSYLNRSARPKALQARERCEEWFEEYLKDATEKDLSDTRSRFRSKRYEQHYAAWFELLVHQILLRLGFSVSIHPELPGVSTHPDFAAVSDGLRILVEATVVAPENDPFKLSPFEEDADRKFQLVESENFIACLHRPEETLDRFLKRKEIEREFRRIFAKHNPNEVQRLFDQGGWAALPTEEISFGDWNVLVDLQPVRPSKRKPRPGRVVPWGQTAMTDFSVPQAQQKIKHKRRKYGPTEDPLIPMVNVHNRFGFDPVEHGYAALFGTGGIWNEQLSPRSCPVAVVFFSETNSHTVESTQICLFVNPRVRPETLPPGLRRLPRIQGGESSERIDGESVAQILGLD